MGNLEGSQVSHIRVMLTGIMRCCIQSHCGTPTSSETIPRWGALEEESSSKYFENSKCSYNSHVTRTYMKSESRYQGEEWVTIVEPVDSIDIFDIGRGLISARLFNKQQLKLLTEMLHSIWQTKFAQSSGFQIIFVDHFIISCFSFRLQARSI